MHEDQFWKIIQTTKDRAGDDFEYLSNALRKIFKQYIVRAVSTEK
jgi:hypothetical protein